MTQILGHLTKHDLKMKSENGGSLIRKFKVAIAQEIRCNHQLKTAPRDVNARPLFALRFYWWPRQQKKKIIIKHAFNIICLNRHLFFLRLNFSNNMWVQAT